ncbi:flagellar biosynthesis chaperone FliJ [Staphylococcus haemolyticus]|uniref:hypothetical protein n=1 Tax=Staphylococcus TaxID=1279 RepID=UPI0008A8833B|nr:hypothetical protein [Staphylococcus sp. HMSC057G10]OHO94715.1 hypothetical protein HMPREF2563_05955 [Staphylococcus sp. HMSC057G10]
MKADKKKSLLILSSIISIIVIIGGFVVNKDKDTYISESYVSLAAFIMLIVTAILQNIDLNMQREELELSRKEMEAQTKEFSNNNIQSKFFEILKLREEAFINVAYTDIVKYNTSLAQETKANTFSYFKNHFFELKCKNKIYDIEEYYLKRFYELYFENPREMHLRYHLNESEKKELDEFMNKSFVYSIDDSIRTLPLKGEINRLIQYDRLINKILEQENSNNNEEVSFKSIYNGILTEEERILYDLANKTIKYNKILNR